MDRVADKPGNIARFIRFDSTRVCCKTLARTTSDMFLYESILQENSKSWKQCDLCQTLPDKFSIKCVVYFEIQSVNQSIIFICHRADKQKYIQV